MASFGWVSYGSTEVTDGTAWCSSWENKVAKNGSTNQLKATKGFNGKTKCQWQIVAEDNSIGPTIKITKSDALDYNLHWIEWGDKGLFSTDGVLPATEGTQFQLGAYAEGTNGEIYPNPLENISTIAGSNNFVKNGIRFVQTHTDPATDRSPYDHVAGTIGQLNYYPGAPGDFKESQILSIDQAKL